MYDMHYDLLTILYFNMIQNNKFANKKKMQNDLKQIYANKNILGGLINLYFMTPEEMQDELDISIEEMRDIKQMLSQSIQFLESMKDKGIIPYDTDFIYSIEGCDYIKSNQELEELYEMGVRSIIPVWNHQNQYGSGYRTTSGLTIVGVQLVKKAIDLGMIIDISHANEKTFYDILDVYEKNRKQDSIIIATHSNVRSLCDRKRNLNDEQLHRLKDLGGYIGLFTNGNFLSEDNEQISYNERQKHFLRHLDYLIKVIQFDINRIVLSTDDMNFHPDTSYHHLEAFPVESIGFTIYQLLEKHYGTSVAKKLTFENASSIIGKIK